MATKPGRDSRERAEKAADAARTPVDPELVAGDFVPDPWETEPERWRETEPWPS